MEKSKLGIPITVLAAVLCLLGYYGGYVITGILVGYILLKEENGDLRKFAVKVLAVMLAFSVLSTLINLIPSVMGIFYSLIQIFGEDLYVLTLHRIFDFLSTVLSLLRTVVFLLLGYNALTGKETKIPLLDDLLNKYL